MPVTISLTDLCHHLRTDANLPPTDPRRVVIADLLQAAIEHVELYTPTAPDSVANLAAVKFVSYAYDSPGSWRNGNYAVVMVNSGAAGLLGPWRSARAGAVNP